jgi:predicted DNA-binding antitoxin AbrB/MazE fold protein
MNPFCHRELVLESCGKELQPMNLTVEAVYESGVLKPLEPLPQLKEQERVRLTLETISPSEDATRLIEQQRQRRIQIEPHVAREIGDSHEYDLLGS